MNIPRSEVLRRYGCVFVVLIALMGCVPVAFAQDWMPDANLRVAVREDLGLAADAELTQAKMADLINLHESKAGITNITGIEHATNLQTFVLWGNSFSDLSPLTNLTALTEIRIGDCGNISDVSPLENLTNLTKLGLQGNNISDVSALSGLVNLTWLRLVRNPVTDFSPLSGLKANITDVDITIPDPDTMQPTVSITAPSGVQNGAFDATITFSESVSNFVQGDVSLSGTATASITDWNTTDDTVFTATITPTTSGTVILDIAADVATDAANNGNTAAVQQTVTVDIDKPSVTITVPSGTQDSAFDATITFTETISNFVQSDVSLSGTATASITNWTANADEKVYTATITPTTSGTVTLDIAADVATDAVNNGNTAATSQSVTVQILVVQQQVLQPDTMAPTVGISVPSGTQNSAFDATITFSESVSDFVQGDVSLSGTATASITAWSTDDNTVFTATIRPTTSGTVILDIAADVATDAASNGNTAATQQSVTVDPALSTWMPDANLRSAVHSALGLADGDTFTQADMAELTALDLEFKEITVLTGLEHAVNLTELILYGNEIRSITPLAGLTALTELELGLNQISDITPLTNLTALTELRLYENKISNITPVAGLTALTVLELGSNQISDITPVAGLTALTELYLGSNQISDITPVAGLTALTKLDLGRLDRGDISDITPLEGLTALTHLWLGNHQISDITPVAGLTALTDLRLGSNQISDITPLTELTALTLLKLHYNQISNITPLTNLTALTVLYLYGNQISDVTPLEGLTALRELTLSSNPIADFAPLRRLKRSNQGLVTDITITLYPSWDVNEDGNVDNTDLALVTAALGQSGEDIVNPRTDVDGDGVVDNDDLLWVTTFLDADNGAPSSSGLLTLLDPATLDAQLEILRVKSDGSLKYLRAIALLESVLAAMTPDKTQLLANYPNPFNPETWIPYHLANPSNVRITIYDARGTIVRQLDLGHQREGYYTNRSRAAYWDGRNDLGERVASGIYFYKLEADNVSFLRKMLILK